MALRGLILVGLVSAYGGTVIAWAAPAGTRGTGPTVDSGTVLETGASVEAGGGAAAGGRAPGGVPPGGTTTEPAAPPTGLAAELGGEGQAVIDTDGSARRQAELERTPRLPQVFLDQWHYREPPPAALGTRTEEHAVVGMTLTEAVHAALEHNPGVASQRLTPLRALEQVRQAEAVFDPTLLLSVNKDRREAPNSSALAGVQVSVTENVNGNVTLKKKLRTGADFAIDFTNNRFVSNARFQGLVPQYRPELVLSLNQPLLRNFGSNFAYLLVDISGISSEAARFTYRAQLADFVQQVVQAYWNVVFARQNLEVQRQSLSLADQTLHENSERVRVGLLAPVSVKEAQSQAAAREAQVLVAENALDVAEQTLRQIVYLRAEDTIVPKMVDPVEAPRTAPVGVDRARALATALEERPEIIAQNLQVRSLNLTARVQENQLLPRVDLVGNVGLNGLGGDAVPVELTGGGTAVSKFDGSYGKALDRLASKDFYSYKAGVEIEIPLANAAAKSVYAQARIDVAQAELDRRQLVSNVTLEVNKAVNDVLTNAKRIQSTRVARELAEENLHNQQRRLDVGMATTKDILDFQDQLTTARGNEVQAATDYNVSLGELARAQGTLLDKYSVVVEVPGQRFTPWWAHF